MGKGSSDSVRNYTPWRFASLAVLFASMETLSIVDSPVHLASRSPAAKAFTSIPLDVIQPCGKFVSVTLRIGEAYTMIAHTIQVLTDPLAFNTSYQRFQIKLTIGTRPISTNVGLTPSLTTCSPSYSRKSVSIFLSDIGISRPKSEH